MCPGWGARCRGRLARAARSWAHPEPPPSSTRGSLGSPRHPVSSAAPLAGVALPFQVASSEGTLLRGPPSGPLLRVHTWPPETARVKPSGGSIGLSGLTAPSPSTVTHLPTWLPGAAPQAAPCWPLPPPPHSGSRARPSPSHHIGVQGPPLPGVGLCSQSWTQLPGPSPAWASRLGP